MLAFLAIPILISLFAFILDFIINWRNAIDNYKYLFLYISQYLIFRSWVFLIFFILYILIFNKFPQKKILPFKIIYIVIASALYSKYFYMDDYSITHSEIKQLRLLISCSLSGITVLLFWEKYLSGLSNKT